MQPALTGTGALVTGASSGIGRATALELARHGAAVALLARRRSRLDEVAEEIRSGGGTAEVVVADLSDVDRMPDAVDAAVRALGRLDVAVNNAGLMLLGSFESAPPEEWDRMVSVNIASVMHLSRLLLPHLVESAERPPRRVADLVNIGSLAGRKVFPGGAAYSATKFAVGALSEGLRQETASRHVRVSVVEPGAVATELASHNRPEVQEALRGGAFAGVEQLEADDVADLIGYLVTRPRRVALNQLLIRPTEQAS